MIKLLTGKYQKQIAVFLFFIFYTELLGGLYAAGHSFIEQFNHHPVDARTHFLFNQPVEKTLPVNNIEPPAIKIIPEENTYIEQMKIIR